MLLQLDHERNLKLDAFERVEELQRTVSFSCCKVWEIKISNADVTPQINLISNARLAWSIQCRKSTISSDFLVNGVPLMLGYE